MNIYIYIYTYIYMHLVLCPSICIPSILKAVWLSGNKTKLCKGTVPSNSFNDHLVCLCPERFAWQQPHWNDCKRIPGTPSS